MRRHESDHRRLPRIAALLAAFVMGALCLAPATAAADDDDFRRAKAIAVNQTYTASAHEASDDAWYRFDLTQAGPVKIKLTSSVASWGEWEVSLYDASRRDDDDILEYEARARNGSFETAEIGLAAGTYYLEVEGDDDDDRRDATYGLLVSHTASGSWETETNDGPRLADELRLNSAIKATTTHVDDDDDDRDDFDDDDDWDDDDDDEDEDWFKFTLSGSTDVRLAFSNAQRNHGGWNVQLFSERDFRSSRALLAERHHASEAGFESKTLTLGAGTYYVKVDPNVGTGGASYSLELRTGASSGQNQGQNQGQSPEPVNGERMYRLYNQWTGEHFYTSSNVEQKALVSIGWTDEGTGWVAPTDGKPVYRLFNPYTSDHHYTTSYDEYVELGRIGWKQEGEGWRSGGSTPVYRLYNPFVRACTHHYTTSKAENDSLVALGWVAEGVGWYANE